MCKDNAACNVLITHGIKQNPLLRYISIIQVKDATGIEGICAYLRIKANEFQCVCL